jgi:hypothetical protein
MDYLAEAYQIQAPCLFLVDPERSLGGNKANTESNANCGLQDAFALLALLQPRFWGHSWPSPCNYARFFGRQATKRDNGRHLINAVLALPRAILNRNKTCMIGRFLGIFSLQTTKRDRLINYLLIINGIDRKHYALRDFLIHAVWSHIKKDEGTKASCLLLLDSADKQFLRAFISGRV